MRNRSAITRQVSHIALAVLLGSVLLLALSPLIGIRFDVVLSGSMSPALETGDLVVVTEVSPSDLKEGDIIIFNSPMVNGLVCHRIVGVVQDNGLAFQTKGDNNEDQDPFLVPSTDVVGEVQTSVPWLGHVVQYLRGPFGLLLMVALILANVLIPDEAKRTRNDKEAGDAEAAAQDNG